jgi:hypothetical protein
MKPKATILICVLLFWANDYAVTNKSTVKPGSYSSRLSQAYMLTMLPTDSRMRSVSER